MIVVLLTACIGPGGPAKRGDTAAEPGAAATGPSTEQVSTALIDAVVLHHTDALIARATELASAAETFCAAPSADGLQAVRDAWSATRGAWKLEEITNFGPMQEEPWRIGPKMDFWPGRPDSVDAYIASDAGLDVADFDAMGGATRGLPALEVVLWDGGDSLATIAAEPRRCAFVVGGTKDVQVLAERYRAAWTTDWRARLIEPSSADDDDYETHQDVLGEWVNRAAFTIEDLRFEKLGKPLGDDYDASPNADTLESRPSARSLLDARDALTGVGHVMRGGVDTDGPLGILDLLPAEDADLIPAFEDAFAAAEAALIAIPEPLEAALTSDALVIRQAMDALRDLQIVVQVDIAQALSVTIVHNDNDGD